MTQRMVKRETNMLKCVFLKSIIIKDYSLIASYSLQKGLFHTKIMSLTVYVVLMTSQIVVILNYCLFFVI